MRAAMLIATGSAAVLFALSLISLMHMRVSIVTQSPFFLYGNAVYTASLVAVLTMTLLTIRSQLHYTTALVLLLCALIMTVPYAVYFDSLPLYNDQLGFVGEVISGVLHGRVVPLQGDLTTLGHAYFTATFILTSGLEPLQGVIAVQLALPLVCMLLLRAVEQDARSALLIALVALAAMLNPLYYGRASFGQLYLTFLSAYLLSRHLRGGGTVSVPELTVLALTYAAYVITHPASLIVPLLLLIATAFNARLALPALLTLTMWLSSNLVLYLSGSAQSMIRQLSALIEEPAEVVPIVMAPATNPVQRLYAHLRELSMAVAYLIGAAASVVVLRRVRSGELGRESLALVACYLALVLHQVIALLMGRWGMVPHYLYLLTVMPALLLAAIDRRLRSLALVTAALLVVLSPVVKWGFSPIAFPTAHDIAEATFLASHTSEQITVCTLGAHMMLWFYYRLHNISASVIELGPLPLMSTDDVPECSVAAIFYRSFNIYRLDISESRLAELVMALDRAHSVIYKDGLWTAWLK